MIQGIVQYWWVIIHPLYSDAHILIWDNELHQENHPVDIQQPLESLQQKKDCLSSLHVIIILWVILSIIEICTALWLFRVNKLNLNPSETEMER